MPTTIPTTESSVFQIERLAGSSVQSLMDVVAAEEPLEIQLGYGNQAQRKLKPISVTMRTPGHDAELALGFLFGEGVIRDIDEVQSVTSFAEGGKSGSGGPKRVTWPARNAVKIDLCPDVEVNLATLQRNFYTTSSCGVCGKASIVALRSLCPPSTRQTFRVPSAMLHTLPSRIQPAQQLFHDTGGIHSAALFNRDGELLRIREDVGRHNALDKLVGAALWEDQLPLRNRLLLLSGRVSFELMQKSLMAGIPMVAAIGAPSTLAIILAKEFDITLVGFLRRDRLNVYHGMQNLLL